MKMLKKFFNKKENDNLFKYFDIPVLDVDFINPKNFNKLKIKLLDKKSLKKCYKLERYLKRYKKFIIFDQSEKEYYKIDIYNFDSKKYKNDKYVLYDFNIKEITNYTKAVKRLEIKNFVFNQDKENN